mmetsp:Transcript_11049/g.23682  ORF Transcript_11049/g.23682 Transcript_11049/m.23682 type:complete len:328 (-) Transcript_11049:53-1036(-)
MGLLVDGVWHDQWYDTKSTGGKFVRADAQYRNWVTKDGSPGPTGQGGFKAETGRYHLYISLACPWAHRTLIMRELKGLHDIISISVVNWVMLEKGWTFEANPGVIPDPINSANFMHEIYTLDNPQYSGRVTVPVLFDKQTRKIVSNESSEIIRMLTEAFDDLPGVLPGDYYPAEHRAEIDQVNERVYNGINNGVYKAGFATAQGAYEEAVAGLFAALDWAEERLAAQRYLVRGRLTEADVRLFTTLVRFDAVYVGHFKCNLRRIADYPAVSAYLRDLYQTKGFGDTVNMQHIKGHYYQSHVMINPSGVVPAGPSLDFSTPHGREALP